MIKNVSENVLITRKESSDEGTFGTLVYDSFQCFTGELPDLANASSVSCIPRGTYKVCWTYSDHFKRKMFQVCDVPKREGIRIHAANLMGNEAKGFKKQLNGCIALGFKLGTIDNQKAVLVSKPAVRQFEALMGERSFTLEIR